MQRVVVVGALALVVLAICFAAACGIQRRVLYPQPPAPPGEPRLPQGTEIVWLGPDSNVEAWFMRPAAAEGSFPVVIFTHGNGELIDHWSRAFTRLTAAGVGAMLVEYPGYGRSGGRPNQQSITEVIVAAHDFVADQPGVDDDAIVAHGRSLGGGAACALAAERPLAALVLESTFTSVREMLSEWGFFDLVIVDPFDNLEVVSSLDIPVLVLHGQHDDLIPVSHGEELAAASETELVRMPCRHNDCPSTWPAIEAFMSDHGLLRR